MSDCSGLQCALNFVWIKLGSGTESETSTATLLTSQNTAGTGMVTHLQTTGMSMTDILITSATTVQEGQGLLFVTVWNLIWIKLGSVELDLD